LRKNVKKEKEFCISCFCFSFCAAQYCFSKRGIFTKRKKQKRKKQGVFSVFFFF